MQVKTNIILATILCAGINRAMAQHAPASLPPAYVAGININYVRSWDVMAPEKNTDNIHTSTPLYKAVMKTQYMDGLGRPIQMVIKQISPSGGDMVSPIVYDGYGREPIQFLPFVANHADEDLNTSDGLFKFNPFQQQASFYDNNNILNPLRGQDEQFFYNETVLENAALNRVKENYAAGVSWAGEKRGVSIQYLVNSDHDSVRIWKPGSAVNASPITSNRFAKGTLYKFITTGEDLKEVIEYKDKNNRLILKKIQLSPSPGSAHIGWVCT